MLNPVWTYYAPEEVADAVEHIDLLVERGFSPGEAAQDAARIYRLRTGDFRTPFLRAHLERQWRVRRRGGPGPLPGRGKDGWQPKPSKYPTEVSLRAFLYRLFHE
jgi:uncharacterized protein YoaH (UPF0181 family)